MQSKLGSAFETGTNTIVGLATSLTLNATVLPMLGFQITHTQNFIMVVVYTTVSIIRQYFLRRFFNWLERYSVVKWLILHNPFKKLNKYYSIKKQ